MIPMHRSSSTGNSTATHHQHTTSRVASRVNRKKRTGPPPLSSLALWVMLIAVCVLFICLLWIERSSIPEDARHQFIIRGGHSGSSADSRLPLQASIDAVVDFFNHRLGPQQQHQHRAGLDELLSLLQHHQQSSSSGHPVSSDNSSPVVQLLMYMNGLMDVESVVFCNECPPSRLPSADRCHYERFSFLTRIVDHIYTSRTDLQVRFPHARNLHKCAFMHHIFMGGGWKRYGPLFVLSNRILASLDSENRIQDQSSNMFVTLDNFEKIYNDKYCKWGVNVIGSIKGEFGIGETSRSTVKALLEPSDKYSKVPVSITDLGNMDNHRTADDLIERKFGIPVKNSNEYMISIVHAGFHELLHQKKTMKNNDEIVSKYKIGMWNWELERFPESWIIDIFDHYDEIWAPSLFNLDVFAEKATQPIVKMPYIVDLSDIASEVKYDRQKFGIPENAFAFLITFDFMSYPERKNPDGALRAFVEAFPSDFINTLKQEERQGKRKPWQRPVFVFKSINVQTYAERFGDTEKYAQMKRIAKGRDDVLFLEEHLSRHDSFSLKMSVDCFVSLHRAEGFGFNLAEAMYLGKPVIGTAYSSTLDFMTPFNSYLVDMEIVSIKNGYGVYQTGYHWAEPNVAHAAKLMRHVFEHPREAADIGHRGAKTIKEMFSPQPVGERMKQRLEYIKKRILKMPSEE